ncbi:MAG: glycosyltransferase family 2 protein [Georgenia sp.]
MTAPRTSVVIPLYNGAGSIADAIASVLRQTDQDFEIVVVDDGSSDGSAAVVAAVDDPRVRLLEHERNRGVAAARNTAVAAARGTRIAFLDADDTLDPTYLESVGAAMTGDVDLVVAGHAMVHADGTRIPVSPGTPGVYPRRVATVRAMQDRIAGLAGGTVVDRAIASRVPFPEGLRRYEDLATTVAYHSFSRATAVLPEPLYLYRVSDQSATWGRPATPDEVERAMEHAARMLNPEVDGPDVRAALRSLRVLSLLVCAQSAMTAPQVSARDRAAVREAARHLHTGDMLATARARPDYAAAALLLKAAPAVYRVVYRRYARRRYAL